MKLSIAMATYNGERFLPAQLHSFVSQSRMPDELVVSDDQSTDGTVPLLLEFQRHAPFLVDIQVNPARLGPTRNFDQALARTTGDLVLLSDQDDVWFDTKIASLEAAALANVEKACFISDALLVDGDLKPSGKTKMGQIRNAGLPATDMVMGCCAAFRRSLLDVLLPIPGDQAAHDNWLVQFADLLELVERSQVPQQLYRRHGGNVSAFFVNSPESSGSMQRLSRPVREMLRRMTTPGGLAAEHRFLVAVTDRLANRSSQVRQLVGSNADSLFARVQDRAALLGRRQALRRMPRSRRFGKGLAMWKRGEYSTGAVASALKDLLVRTEPGEPPC